MGFFVGFHQGVIAGYSTGVGVLDDDHGWCGETACGSQGDIKVEQVIVR